MTVLWMGTCTHGTEDVAGHNEFNSTECPGKNWQYTKGCVKIEGSQEAGQAG